MSSMRGNGNQYCVANEDWISFGQNAGWFDLCLSRVHCLTGFMNSSQCCVCVSVVCMSVSLVCLYVCVCGLPVCLWSVCVVCVPVVCVSMCLSVSVVCVCMSVVCVLCLWYVCGPGRFDDMLVRHQVKYLGLMEHLRVRRAGFAYRRKYEIFLER